MILWQEICERLGAGRTSKMLLRARDTLEQEGLVWKQFIGQHFRWVTEESFMPQIKESVIGWQREEYPTGQYGPYVDPKYVKEWIDYTLPVAGSLENLAFEMKIDIKQMYRWREECAGIPFIHLEDALWRYGCIHVDRIVPDDGIRISL